MGQGVLSWAQFGVILGLASALGLDPAGALTLTEIMAEKEKAKQGEGDPSAGKVPSTAPVSALALVTQAQQLASVEIAQAADQGATPLPDQAPEQDAEPVLPIPFSTKVVEDKIREDLRVEYGDEMDIRFSPWKLPAGKQDEISKFIVEEMHVNDKRTKVSALVHFDIQGQLVSMKVRGTIEQLIEVPSVNRAVHFGDIITKEDITWIKISGRQSNRFLITKEEDLIGRQPRSGFLKPGMPVQQRDIERIRDVQKGSIIKASFKTDRLDLTTKVRALEHGCMGDNIRVLNVESNKILYGVVVAPSEVSLAPPPPEAVEVEKSVNKKKSTQKKAAKIDVAIEGEFDLALQKDAQATEVAVNDENGDDD